MSTKYHSITLQHPLINLETKLRKCVQCWAKKKVLVYRSPIQALIQGNQVVVGKEILLCLDCLTKGLKARSKHA